MSTAAPSRQDPRPLHDRLRRQSQPGAREARHRHARARADLAKASPSISAPTRPLAADGPQARRDLRVQRRLCAASSGWTHGRSPGSSASTPSATPSQAGSTQGRADITEARAIELVRAALGDPDIPVQIDASCRGGRWPTMPTAIAGQCVPRRRCRPHHAAEWRLWRQYRRAGCAQSRLEARHGAARGRRAGLLDTYNEERHPLGALTVRAGLCALCAAHRALSRRRHRAEAASTNGGMEIGHKYRSRAIMSDPGEDDALTDDPRQSAARPGTRAPHLLAASATANCCPRSICSAANFVLLTGTHGMAWKNGRARGGGIACACRSTHYSVWADRGPDRSERPLCRELRNFAIRRRAGAARWIFGLARAEHERDAGRGIARGFVVNPVLLSRT